MLIMPYEAKTWKDWWENGFLGRILSMFSKKYLGTGLTDAQKEANEFTAGENTRAMNFSAVEAQKNRDFQAEQAATQWQRGVADMRAAGLNPALAYCQGGASAMSGSAPSGVSGSSVAPDSGASLSELLELAYIGKKRALYDAQIDEAKAGAEEKRANANRTNEQTKWISADMLSMLGLREDQRKEISARIENYLASAEGQRIQNEWTPQLLSQQLVKGKVEIAAGLVGIEKAQEEIKQLILQHANTQADTAYKYAQRTLALASACLANAQTDSVNLDIWQKQFEQAFEMEYGTKPNQPIWNAITGLLGKASHDAANAISNWSKKIAGEAEALGRGVESVVSRLGENAKNNIERARQNVGYSLAFD